MNVSCLPLTYHSFEPTITLASLATLAIENFSAAIKYRAASGRIPVLIIIKIVCAHSLVPQNNGLCNCGTSSGVCVCV